jgi:hypothetical protein
MFAFCPESPEKGAFSAEIKERTGRSAHAEAETNSAITIKNIRSIVNSKA